VTPPAPAWLDAVFPRRCRLCGCPADDDLACPEHALPAAPCGPRCRRCAAPLPPALAASPEPLPCADCARRSPGFDRLVALADYRAQPVVQAWILALKYGGRRDLGRPLGCALASALRPCLARSARPVIVPVPLHPLRAFWRGCDPARRIARACAEALELDFGPLLVRRRATPPQGAPGSVSRAANVRGAFELRPRSARRLRGRPVWLVDDVVTSGATVRECARVLRRAGATRVSVTALARAGRPGPPDRG